MLGKHVLRTTGVNQIDISNLKSGVYFIKIKSINDKLTKKLIKK